MAEVAIAILELDTTSRKSPQIQPGLRWIMVAAKRLFHESIHAPAPIVLTIGKHRKRIPQLTRGHDISPIHLPRQWIIHQLHADPV
jgi:hypothetical protein